MANSHGLMKTTLLPMAPGLWVLGALVVYVGSLPAKIVAGITGQAQEVGAEAGLTWSMIGWSAGGLFCATLAYAGLLLAKKLVEERVERRCQAAVQQALYGHLLRLDPRVLATANSDELNNRAFMDVQSVTQASINTLISIPAAIVGLVIVFIDLFKDGDWLPVVLIPFMALPAWFLLIDRRIQAASGAMLMAADAMRSRTGEVLRLVGMFRANAAFSTAERLVDERITEAHAGEKKIVTMQAWMASITELVNNLPIVLLIVIGGWVCMVGLTVAQGAAVGWDRVIHLILLLPFLMRPARELAGMVLMNRMSAESSRRLDEVFGWPAPLTLEQSEPVEVGGAVAAADLVVQYEDVRVLDGVSVAVEAGEHVAIVGPAGCGKSTLVKAMAGHVMPMAGMITVGGHDLHAVDRRYVARSMGVVAQESDCLAGTIRSNILLGLRRPVPDAIEDGEGPLDLRAAGLASHEDLDRRLIEVLDEVALAEDIFYRVLGAPAPATPAGQQLTAALTQWQGDRRTGVVQPSATTVFPGSLLENLFGPGMTQWPELLPPWMALADLPGGAVLMEAIGPGAHAGPPTAGMPSLPDGFSRSRSTWSPAEAEAIVMLRSVFGDMGWAFAEGGQTVRDVLWGGRLADADGGVAERQLWHDLQGTDLCRLWLIAGLDMPVGEGGQGLSGGQQQKVCLARALIRRPRLLLLDEATASLDQKSQQHILDCLRQEYRQTTIVTVTHRSEVLERVDRILVMDRGAVAASMDWPAMQREGGLEVCLQSLAVPQGAEADPVAHTLATSPLFVDARHDEIRALAARCEPLHLSAGTEIFHVGDPAGALYLLLDGEVLFQSAAGTEVTRYTAGRVFGEIAALTGCVRTLTATAATDVHLMQVDRAGIISLLDRNGRLARVILEQTAQRLGAQTSGLEEGTT